MKALIHFIEVMMELLQALCGFLLIIVGFLMGHGIIEQASPDFRALAYVLAIGLAVPLAALGCWLMQRARVT